MGKERFKPETVSKYMRFMADVQASGNSTSAGVSHERVNELKKKHSVAPQIANYLLRRYTEVWTSGMTTYYRWRKDNKNVTLKQMAQAGCAYLQEIRERAAQTNKERIAKRTCQPSAEQQLAEQAVPVVWDEQEKAESKMRGRLNKDVESIIFDINSRIAKEQDGYNHEGLQMDTAQAAYQRAQERQMAHLAEKRRLDSLLAAIKQTYNIEEEKKDE